MSNSLINAGEAPSASTLDRQRNHGPAKPYTVTFEAVTQEKKPLKTVDADPRRIPRGYTFVPVGYPQVTEYCKEQCRQQGEIVYTLSNAGVKASDLAKQVGRRGLYFPDQIVIKANAVHGSGSANAGVFKVRGGKEYRDDELIDAGSIALRLQKHRRRLRRNATTADEKQILIDQVQAVIKELFPKIPEADVQAISDRAFAEGADTVGNAKDIPLPQRVQLAVGAHARHTHTHYDQLLKVVEWDEARKEIQRDVLDVLVRWRGEGKPEENAHELEEILREVIVIGSDDDDDNEEDYEPPEPVVQAPRGRDVGYVSPQQSRHGASLETASRPHHPQLLGDSPHYERIKGISNSARRDARRQAGFTRQVEESMRRHNLVSDQADHFLPQERGRAAPAYDFHPHQQQPLPSQDLTPRPMFISSADPNDARIVNSIEDGDARKRKSFHDPSSPMRDTHVGTVRRRLEPPQSPRYREPNSAHTPMYRRIDGEDVEVIDLRTLATRPMHDYRAAASGMGIGDAPAGPSYYAYPDPARQYAQHEPIEHYGNAGYGHAGRRRQYVDAVTGEPVMMDDNYEVLTPYMNGASLGGGFGYHH